MVRKIITINREKCNGCGLCAGACHEGAIGVIDGKAVLLREDYCDGLGNCLPVCPTGAITFEERDAAKYDEAAVRMSKDNQSGKTLPPGGCPGSNAKTIRRNSRPVFGHTGVARTQLGQWPVQIKLVPVNAPYFDNANLLISADCGAYAYGNFHNDFMRNKIVLIGCPKLDEGDYGEKLTEILKQNSVKSVTVIRMEVPCCGGIENAAAAALKNSGRMIPWRVIVLSVKGEIQKTSDGRFYPPQSAAAKRTNCL
ncbi:MAG: 4Fe-4S binding protein [Spirochaetaceae bacterium]|jgi:NAD-dependent dihydropyrimidine dehydrogenase PreA subunit|nr:4Fe-4S binding protein [Spirochaetaceae bacterium]